MSSVINWFQIPVRDFNRASKFYGKVLGKPLEKMEMGGDLMGFLPMRGKTGVGGAIVKGKNCIPSKNGTMVFLNAGNDLRPFVERVEKAGGKIVVPRTFIRKDIGYFAIFLDTEGNRVAFHSPK